MYVMTLKRMNKYWFFSVFICSARIFVNYWDEGAILMDRKIEHCFETGNLKKLQTKFRKYLRLYIDKIEYEKL